MQDCPWGCRLMNKWWFTHYWGLYEALPTFYMLQASLLMISCSNHLPIYVMRSSFTMVSSSGHFPFAIFSLLQPVMKIWHPLLNAMIWCSFACEVLGMPAISESNPFVSMPLSSKFMNKWWLTHYWVLQQALILLYVLQASLLTISFCNHLPNHIMCSYRYSLMFWPSIAQQYDLRFIRFWGTRHGLLPILCSFWE